MGFRLITGALLALLPRSSFGDTEHIDDALLTMEEVRAPTPTPDGVSGLSVDDEDSINFPLGSFFLQRSQVIVPPGEAQAYWFCTGGKDLVENRMVLFEPNVTFDEIAINTSTWQHPYVDYWNATLNVHVFEKVFLPGISFWGGGSACACSWFQLNFGEWLKSNSQAGSVIATDFFQNFNRVPFNFFYPTLGTKYLSPDFDFWAWTMEELYTGEPLSSVSSGWHPPTTLEGTSLIKTKNRYLRIKNTGGPVTLRVFSNSPEPYGIVAYLFKENPDPSNQQDYRPINLMELYASDVSDVTEALAMTFASIQEGYYYSIFIENKGEDQLESVGEPPYECTIGPNALSTKYDVTYSLQSCAEAACNAGAIAVHGILPPSSVGKAVAGRASMLFGFAALFAIF